MATALRRFPDLNSRQRDLLDRALKYPEQVHTFQSHRISQGISQLTARADLLDLVQRGLLTEIKQGRQRGFLPAADLDRRLNPKPKKKRRSSD